MKKTFLIFFNLALAAAYGQHAVNSGAVSGNSLIQSVGEVYVLPTGSANGASSGTIGAVSRIEFLTLGIDEVVADAGIKIYPNPTANSVFFESTAVITKVEIYDASGRLVATKAVDNNQADLSMLQSGTYIIRTNNNQSFKIIKK